MFHQFGSTGDHDQRLNGDTFNFLSTDHKKFPMVAIFSTLELPA